MNTTKRSLKVLEWSTILINLSKHAASKKGKELCLNLPLYSDINKIRLELTYTTEAKILLDHLLTPPLSGIRDIEDFLNLSKTSQSLGGRELLDIAKTIQSSRYLKNYFLDNKEKTPFLYEVSKDLFEDKELEDIIFNVFDDNGNILDSASPELKRLRNRHKDQMNNLKDRLSSIIGSSEISKYLQESVYTQREDRYVVPVKVDNKAHVPGIIHDVSASGATVFIEPKAIVELNNSIKETEIKIETEIKRILKELTEKVGIHASDILKKLPLIIKIDFSFAKAKYSIQLKANEPELNSEKYINIKNMKHPILLTMINQVIPNDIEIGKDFNSLIITGANTGGKTVTLKALGLCVLMTRAGLHIPVLEANIFPFRKVFADIGDEQSIEQSLSTFSGHLTNIIDILKEADDNSLVLLDEVGAGTDPSEGSALAQALLEDLNLKKTVTIASTHYGELKALAYTKEGFQNASVEFDSDTLAPTYRLLIGIPGKSNAITIAGSLGLDKSITNKAREIYLTQKDTTGAVLEGLQNTQHQLSQNVQEAESAKTQMNTLKLEYEEKLEKIKSDKKKTLAVYKKKYEALVDQARSEIREILKQIRTQKSEKLARRSMSRISNIEAGLRTSVDEDQGKLKPSYKKIDWDNIKTGDTVFVKDFNQMAILVSLPDKNKNVQIQMGLLKTTIKTNKLAFSDKKIEQKTSTTSKVTKGFKFTRAQVSHEIDLRGVRVEEALDRVEKYLDDASLANLSPVYVIHGHGTGALKEAIREYLKTSPYVAKFRPGSDGEGGDGVSVIDLV